MREQLQFFEYETKETNLTNEEFEILTTDFSNRISVFQIGQENYRVTAQQYVGNIILPHHVLIIRPKIPNLNFFRMLFFTYNLIPEFRAKQWEYAKEQEIFELIITRFLENIEMLTKRGFSKGYIEEEDNLHFAKGRVLIEENLRKNPILRNRIFCRYSDFTSDTTENRILKYTLYHLSRVKIRNNLLLKRVKQAIHFFDQVSFVVISSKNFPQVRYTRLTEHYRPIVNLCQLIIQNSTLNLQKSGEIRYSSFLIDMNRLFENFILGFLKKKLKGFSVRGAGRGTQDYALDVLGEMTQKPDIIIRKDNLDILVIDAKYKQLQTNEKKQIEIVTADARQVLSYCLSPRQKLPFGVLVYPKHQLVEKTKERYPLKPEVTLILRALDLSKSTTVDFERECDSFAAEIVYLIENEVMPKINASALRGVSSGFGKQPLKFSTRTA